MPWIDSDIDKLFDELTKLNELKSKINQTRKLNFGNEDAKIYNGLYEGFINNYMPKSAEEFIDLITSVYYYNEKALESGIEDARSKMAHEINELIKKYM